MLYLLHFHVRFRTSVSISIKKYIEIIPCCFGENIFIPLPLSSKSTVHPSIQIFPSHSRSGLTVPVAVSNIFCQIRSRGQSVLTVRGFCNWRICPLSNVALSRSLVVTSQPLVVMHRVANNSGYPHSGLPSRFRSHTANESPSPSRSRATFPTFWGLFFGGK